jgi:hypothetical protein
MKTTNSKDINGSYKTADGKAQIDFGITYRNGYAKFTASGFYDGSSGQCIDEIAKAYPENEMVKSLAALHCAHHLEVVKDALVDKVKRAAENFPAVSFYDTQAEQFLTSNGIKFRATLSDTKTPAWSDNGMRGHHYRVTLSRSLDSRVAIAEESGKAPPPRLTFDFWSSIADADKGIKTVRPYDVLACISGDAYTPETFADFCGEYGYEQDCIKALQTFRRCSAFAKRLRAFFTEAELEQLQEIQ